MDVADYELRELDGADTIMGAGGKDTLSKGAGKGLFFLGQNGQI